MIILLAIAFAAIGMMDLPTLIRNKQWYDLTVFCVFFISAFILALLQTLGVSIPNPMKGAEFIIGDLLHLNYG